MVITLAQSIHDRYDDSQDIFPAPCDEIRPGFVLIVSVSTSPQAKQGKLPKMITLIDYNIETMGELDKVKYPTNHIKEMDLSDNLITDWTEVNKILQNFPKLVFLNLARNVLCDPLQNKTLDSHNLSKVWNYTFGIDDWFMTFTFKV